MLGTFFAEAAQLTSPNLFSPPTSSLQRLDSLATSSPLAFNHSTLSPYAFNLDDDVASLRLHQKTTFNSNVTALLITSAILVLVSALLSSHHSALPKWLQVSLFRWTSSSKKVSIHYRERKESLAWDDAIRLR